MLFAFALLCLLLSLMACKTFVRLAEGFQACAYGVDYPQTKMPLEWLTECLGGIHFKRGNQARQKIARTQKEKKGEHTKQKKRSQYYLKIQTIRKLALIA